MKTIFKVLPVLALSVFFALPNSARAGETGEALGEGCAMLAVPTAVVVGAVGAYHYKDVIQDPRGAANVAALSIGGACAAGAAVGGYAVTVAGAAEAPSQQDLQKPENNDEE